MLGMTSTMVRRTSAPCDIRGLALLFLLASGISSWGQNVATDTASKGDKLAGTVKEVNLPANDNEALAWRFNMRMTPWARSHAATGFEFNTPALVERRVQELKAQGYNTINDGALFWNLEYTDRWDELIAMVKMICNSAHRHGMKVIHHMDGAVAAYMGTGVQYMSKHPDWLQRDIRYGIPTLAHMCLSNPGFCDEIFARLVRFTKETGIDGFMIDEVYFSTVDYCGCPYCRKAFTQATGLVLPMDPASGIFGDYESRVWVEWLKWRARAVGDWYVALRKALLSVSRNICLMTYTTNWGVFGRQPAKDYGLDLMEWGRGCDFVGSEIMSRNVFDCYRPEFSFRKVKSAIGDHFGSAIWGLVYHSNDRNIAYFGWALSQMHRQTTWMDIIPGVDMLRYLDWPRQVKKDRAASVADTAILFSAASRDFAKKILPEEDPDFFLDTWGYSQVLGDGHIQHDFILDEDLNTAKLARYKLVILAGTHCMSAEHVEAVRKHVAGGGVLLVSGAVATQDEDGFWAVDFQLGEVMGVEYRRADPVIVGPNRIKWAPSGKMFTYPMSCLKSRTRADANAEVLAEFIGVEDRPVAPAIVVNRYGSGKCIFLAAPLGFVNCEPSSTPGQTWTFEKNRQLADLLLSVVRCSVSDAFDVKAVAVPERVLMNVHRQKDENAESILVHLLNATGAARFKKGDVVPSQKTGEAFPSLAENLVFDVRVGDIRRSYIVSPDYSEERPVTAERLSDGYLRVTVSKNDLKAYAVVYLQTQTAQ